MTTTPKGWKRLRRLPGELRDNKDIIAYVSNEGTVTIQFSTRDNYRVIIYSKNKKVLDQRFKTKAEAQSFAIRWMRQHPKG